MARDVDHEISYLLGDTQVMGGAYDAGERFDRSLVTWQPSIRTADADILPDKRLTNARAQDLIRNDAFVGAGIIIHQDSIVGNRYRLNAKPMYEYLGRDAAWAKAFSEEVEQKFTAWAEGMVNFWPDAARKNTFTGLVRMAVGVYLAAGETLATVEWRRNQGRIQRPYHTAFQMIDNERLSTPWNERTGVKNVRGGVRMNSYGEPIGFYIRRPGQASRFSDYRYSTDWSYVRARNSFGRPQVIHIVDQVRPAQTRGISPLAASLKELRILSRFRDITLQNAVLNASYAASIESELPSEAVFAALGGGDVGTSVVKYAQEFLGAVQQYSGSARNMQIDGVKIPHFLPGTKLNVHPLGTPGGIGTEFEASMLRYLSANLGVSYEELSRDYTKTNYSSSKAARGQTHRHMQSRKKQCADRFASIGATGAGLKRLLTPKTSRP